MRCLFIFYFLKEKKKCICRAFQLDAAVPEKHLYFFLALQMQIFMSFYEGQLKQPISYRLLINLNF